MNRPITLTDAERRYLDLRHAHDRAVACVGKPWVIGGEPSGNRGKLADDPPVVSHDPPRMWGRPTCVRGIFGEPSADRRYESHESHDSHDPMTTAGCGEHATNRSSRGYDALRDVPPDAGSSYLGTYTLRNEWAIWLLKNDPYLLSVPAGELHRTDVGKAPACPAPAEVWSARARRWYKQAKPCGEEMKYRPGYWCCDRHRDTVRVRVLLKMEPMRLYDKDDNPVRDVLSLIGKDREVEYDKGKWRVVNG